MEEGYGRLRELMVERQLVPRGVRDERVLRAMRKVERHLFMPEGTGDAAYEDRAAPIGESQTISQPYMVAIMTQLLELTGDEKVLEIGTGSGYQAAILSELAGDVFTIERNRALAEGAAKKLDAFGYKNCKVFVGDGALGLEEYAPFDRIIVTAAAPAIPPPLVSQLIEGGIIVAPVGERLTQILVSGRKIKGSLVTEEHFPCAFVPLIGEHGWSV
jgi:protein-L-isoaspartate(D-aspartate) O-methyltransferase